MRSSLVGASLLGLLLATGCTVGDTSTPGGGDDDGVTGDDGVSDDDGIVTPDAALPDPTLIATVDKLTLATELNSENMVTLDLQGGDGFQGLVNVAATAVDDAGALIPGWTVELSAPSATLTENGTGSVVATLKIPSDSTVLTGKVHFAVTSSVDPIAMDSAVTALKQVTISIGVNAGTGQCELPADGTLKVKTGTKVRFLNTSTTDSITIHSDNKVIDHQPDPGSGPGQAYEQTVNNNGTSNTSNTSKWYCHAPTGAQGNHLVEVD